MNSYTGGTTIAGGTLAVGADTALGATAGPLTFDGGILRFDAAFDLAATRAITLDAGGGTFNMNGFTTSVSQDITGPGALTLTGGGILEVSGNNVYLGQTNVLSGLLRAGAADTLSSASAHSVSAGASMDLAGFSQTIAALDNAGTVSLGNNAATTLTVTGNYIGSGGTIVMSTILGNDASPTDRLVVSGDTAGMTNLRINAVGGSGAPTVEGIRVVEVAGVSNGTFSLLGDYVYQGDQAIVAGAYVYRLYQGSVSAPADGDWYLRSVLFGGAPLLQPGAPIYETYSNVLLSMNQLGTLQQRVGNRSWLPGSEKRAVSGGRAESGIWGRVYGAHAEFDPQRSTTDAQSDLSIRTLQIGGDSLIYSSPDERLIAGVSGRYGKGSADINSIVGNGQIDTNGYGVVGTLTLYGAQGFYVDGQAHATWYDSNLFSDTANLALTKGNDGFGYALSLETGTRVDVASRWSLTPQMQLSYSEIDFDSFADVFGARISLDRASSLLGRLGLALNYEDTWQGSGKGTERIFFYAIPSVTYDFLDGSQTDIASVKLINENENLWGGLAFGGSRNWSDDRFSIYGEAALDTSISGGFGDSYVLRGTLGFRARWGDTLSLAAAN